MKTVGVTLVIVLLVSYIILPISYFEKQHQESNLNPQVYFGATFGLNTTAEAKMLIDKMKSFTNLFVVDSFSIDALNETINGTTLTEVCDYATSQGLNIIVYFAYISHQIYPWQAIWVENAKPRYGNKLLGIYFYDEPGGKQIDLGNWSGNSTDISGATQPFENATSYSKAADTYVRGLGSQRSFTDLKTLGIPAFTSDYALQWFDYLAGYNTVLTELGGTNRTMKIQQISLCRGAANVQGKDWGTIVTWNSYNPPYIESGNELLDDLLMAYRAGAKYEVVFNYPISPDGNPYGILTEDQFSAMKSFWSQIHTTQESTFGTEEGEAAFVLPKDYGWGIRNPCDRIWGLWNADNLSLTLWSEKDQLLRTYGLGLDIIYNDTAFNFEEKYSAVYYWNSKGLIINSLPSN
jgi:hypothetical protein